MQLIFPLEILGTIAFAVSGAMVGIEKKMDIFGVCVLGLTASVGGGIIRDVILGITPPIAFRRPVFAVIAIAVSILMFIPAVRGAYEHEKKIYDVVLLVMDSAGLGLFTVIGVQTAFSVTGGGNYFLAVFVGVLTGVGGGIMRDISAGNTPFIFVKHFYACASISGALLCALLWQPLGSTVSMLTGAVTVMVLRLLAARYHWSLPRAK